MSQRSPADQASGRTAAATTPAPADPKGGGPVRRYDTRELFGPDAEIEIIHQQGVYRLKITRQGKLILNK
jgi:hemin uptake protein HemP